MSASMSEKQGIVTFLGSGGERNSAAATSLRRTLSAEMSSKKWLSQNGLKKIASSEQLSHSKATTPPDSSSSSEGEEEKEDECQEMKELNRVWSSIQEDKKEELQHEKPAQLDIWSSILSLKAKEETSNLFPQTPYIHPLVKRSKSSLSQKSLEICTESLGSETGSDGFSSYPPSESEEDKEEEKEQPQQQEETQKEEELQVPKYNYAVKSPTRSFPPPLASLQLRSHRDNGRLFLEAVSVPSQNNFCAQRQEGRLVLTFASDPEEEEEEEESKEEYGGEVAEEEEEEKNHVEELEEEFVEFEEDEDEIETDAKGVTGVHMLAVMLNKPIGLVNRNPELSEEFNQVINFEDVNVVQHGSIAHSLPPRPRVASLHNNGSELIVSGDIDQASNYPHQLLLLRGKNGDYLVHNLKSCKDSRRSFLLWEPHCIAT